TAVRSRPAVTHTRLPSSTSASKSGRISSSSSMETLSSRTSSGRVLSAVLRFVAMLIFHLPDNDRGQTEQPPLARALKRPHVMNTGWVTRRIPLGAYGRSPGPSQARSRHPIYSNGEDSLEMPGVGPRRRACLGRTPRYGFHRRRSQICVPAGDYPVEVAEVGGQVQGEAVADHRTVELDANRGQLFAAAPDAGQARRARLRVDTKLVQVVDERLLQPLDVFRDGQPELLQVEHWVTHQLAGPVIGGLAAPV